MSKYTTQVKSICESLAGYVEPSTALNVDIVLSKCYDKIFDYFNFYDENKRKDICCKILKHYYMREIGEETYGLWRLRMNTVMSEIVDYYNALYKSAEIKFNPLLNKEITTEYSDSGSSSGSSSAEEKSTNKYLDTPQSNIGNLEENKYLTNARLVNGNGTTTGSSNYENSSKETVTGKDGGESYSKLLNEYRETLLKIDIQLINEFADCFMNIF